MDISVGQQGCWEQPLPACLWVNPLKTTTTQLEAWLEAQGLQWEGVSWAAGGYRVWDWPKPGRSLPFITGWYGVQEEIARTAVQALDPQVGDRVLDLCAAPGGKTVQLALAVGETGMVVANERSLSRLSSLWSALTRWGLTNVITSHGDGRDIMAPAHSFDRVLVDAPCSGEGTFRKKLHRNQAGVSQTSPATAKGLSSHRLVPIQQQLLDRALTLVKPGGVVVYSTCTFAPEENEAVVDAVVGDRGVVEPFDIPGLQKATGLTHWHGQIFRGDSIHAHRYWPHLNDTGGFFVARIRRTDVNLAPNAPSLDQTAQTGPAGTIQPAPGRGAIAWLGDRFGMALDQFDAYALWSTGKEKEWLASSACRPVPHMIPHTIGLPLVRRTPHGFKPTTAGLQRFGRHVTQQVATLNAEQCDQFMRGESVTYPGTDGLSPGFVLARSGAYELGCGRWKQGRLYCELPKFLRSQQ
ncbi:MAG: hypothetical protein AB4042_06375 [Leptolyngbyaceae cyanobacterium]